MLSKYSVGFLAFFCVILMAACADDDVIEDTVELDPTPYELHTGTLPPPLLPADNALTKAKVQLGRMLFYERAMSKDLSQSCADCHLQTDGFSDIRQFSLGVEGNAGHRNAMAVFNLAWHRNAFFWDGRSPSLRDQALRPIQDPLEMNETLPNAIAKLEAKKEYRDQFTRAFGDPAITAERIGLAIEQFEISIVSNNSKFDQFRRGEVTLTPSEERGRKLFFAEFDPRGIEKGGECFHCHGGPNFTNDDFMNNGLDADADFTDLGLFEVTANDGDKAKFKVPSLRNIARTPPYMHDGRFQTLEEVIDHYNSGAVHSSTVDILMQYNLDPGLGLSDDDKTDLINFLHTLTDDTFLQNPEYSSPF